MFLTSTYQCLEKSLLLWSISLVNSLPFKIFVLPQEQYLAYLAKLCFILPWTWISMDVDSPSSCVCVFWICWIISTIDFFNCSSFSQSATFFVFLSFLFLNTYSLVGLLLVVTLTSTTFTFAMIICISVASWTSTIIDFHETSFAS